MFLFEAHLIKIPIRTIILVGLLGISENVAQENIDFCNKKLCPHQGIHVACNKSKTFSRNCPGNPKLEPMDRYKELILREHNYYRNLVASGELKCFSPAVRMPILQWDWSLAEVAEYHVRSCVFAHDECRSTPKFPYAGQNLYRTLTSCVNVTTDSFIKEAIFLWFEEQFDAFNEILSSYRRTNPLTSHFTLMVSDRQHRVGCAMVNSELPAVGKRFIIFACNYPSTNIYGMPSYKPGKTASKCRKRNQKYPALCEDPIDPNDFKWYKRWN